MHRRVISHTLTEPLKRSSPCSARLRNAFRILGRIDRSQKLKRNTLLQATIRTATVLRAIRLHRARDPAGRREFTDASYHGRRETNYSKIHDATAHQIHRRMRKRLPPLNWLRAFEASARQLSFTHAAAELNLTQAAVSQQVKGLESQLGTALFKRLPRGLELTEAGLAYLPVVHEAVERLAAATDEIFGEGHVRLLTIRVSLVFFTHWLALRLPDFRERHPEVNLRITSNIWGGDSSVTDVEADMEIRHGHGNWAGLKAERLTWDTLLPVCAPHLPSAQAPLSSPKDLAHHELLHVLGYEEGWGYWLKKAGAARVDSSKGMQFDTLISALKAAELGQGVALARSSLVESMLESGQLIAPLKSRHQTSEAFFLVYSPHNFVNPHAAACAEWLLAKAREAH